MGLACLSFFSCQEKEEPAEINILGEWKIDGINTVVLLNGEGKSIKEMGMEIYGLNEQTAKIHMEEYLQNQILGPLSLTDADVSFDPDLLTVRLGQEQRKSYWQLLNDKTVLKLVSMEDDFQYLFNCKFNSNQEIDLSWEWQIQELDDPTNVNKLELRLKLLR